MKVLVIGNGGREHALAWKLRQSKRVSEVIVAPGNAGTAREGGVRNVPANVADPDELLAIAKREGVELTVVRRREQDLAAPSLLLEEAAVPLVRIR